MPTKPGPTWSRQSIHRAYAGGSNSSLGGLGHGRGSERFMALVPTLATALVDLPVWEDAPGPRRTGEVVPAGTEVHLFAVPLLVGWTFHGGWEGMWKAFDDENRVLWPRHDQVRLHGYDPLDTALAAMRVPQLHGLYNFLGLEPRFSVGAARYNFGAAGLAQRIRPLLSLDDPDCVDAVSDFLTENRKDGEDLAAYRARKLASRASAAG